MKSFKQKQKLYNKFLKFRTKENKAHHKAYKNLFGQSEKKLNRTYYSELFARCKKDIKNTWKVVNEVICNTKNKRKDLSEKFVINNTTVVEKQEIAEHFNKYFTNICLNLSSKIPNEKGYEKYLVNCNFVMNGEPLNDEELRNAFFFCED